VAFVLTRRANTAKAVATSSPQRALAVIASPDLAGAVAE